MSKLNSVMVISSQHAQHLNMHHTWTTRRLWLSDRSTPTIPSHRPLSFSPSPDTYQRIHSTRPFNTSIQQSIYIHWPIHASLKQRICYGIIQHVPCRYSDIDFFLLLILQHRHECMLEHRTWCCLKNAISNRIKIIFQSTHALAFKTWEYIYIYIYIE